MISKIISGLNSSSKINPKKYYQTCSADKYSRNYGSLLNILKSSRVSQKFACPQKIDQKSGVSQLDEAVSRKLLGVSEINLCQRNFVLWTSTDINYEC